MHSKRSPPSILQRFSRFTLRKCRERSGENRGALFYAGRGARLCRCCPIHGRSDTGAFRLRRTHFPQNTLRKKVVVLFHPVSLPVKSVFIPGCGYPNVSFFQFRISQRACHRKMLLQENGNGHVWGVPALWFPEGDQTRIAKAGNHPGFLHIGEIRSHPIRKEK